MKKRNTFYGLFFIGVAILLLLTSMNIISLCFSLWTLVLGLIFAYTLLHSLMDLNYTGAVFSVAFLYMVFDGPLHLPDVGFATLMLVALFLSIGLSFILPNRFKNMHFHDHGKKFKNAPKGVVIDEADDNSVFFSNRFGATSKYVNSDDFQYGSFINEFGEMKVFFDNVKVSGSIAEIDITNSFGEMTLYVPKTWKIEDNIHVFVGAVSEKNDSKSMDLPVLKLKGNVCFGEVAIIYV